MQSFYKSDTAYREIVSLKHLQLLNVDVCYIMVSPKPAQTLGFYLDLSFQYF